MNRNLNETIKECLENGQRLLDEAQLLEFENPRSTRFFLSLIAQEEFAKGFLLYLVSTNVIPWSHLILRASRDHKCKQLLSLIIDYLAPDLNEFLSRLYVAKVADKWPDMPQAVVDALNIFRHEKIGRSESNNWVWAEDPSYDKTALKIAEGNLDREKQNSLYVGVGKQGEVISTPKTVAEEKANEEFERAKRFALFLRGLAERSETSNSDFEKVEDAFRVLFSSLQTDRPKKLD